MENKKRANQAQFETIIDFMERHGDLCRMPQGAEGRLDNLQKWTELTEILNSKAEGDPKPLEKWRKAWSDFKNNTRKKVEKIRRHGGEGPEITDIEKRVLLFLGSRKGRKRKGSRLDSEENGIYLKEEVLMEDYNSFSPPHYYNTEPESSRLRKSSVSSYASTSSSKPLKKKKKKDPETEMKDMTDKFLEFERERERMTHEREMARIKQNDTLLSMFGRIVNVLETLAPSIQKYLDRDTIEDG